MLHVTFSNAEELTSVVNAIATFIEEATFYFTPEGLRLRSMDPSHIALINLEWPNTAFEKYVCDQEYKVSVRMEDLQTILKAVEKKDKVEITLGEENILHLKLYDGYKREFKIHLIEGEEGESRLPKVPFTTSAKITVKSLKKILQDISRISDQVTIISDPEKLLFNGKSEKGELSITLERGSGELIELNVKESAQATYSVEYLLDFVKAVKLATYAGLDFASKMPIRLDFSMEESGIKLEFYLAPRVE